MDIKEISELIAKRESQYGSYGITVQEQDDGEHYELYINGEIDSNFLTAEEAYGQIFTLYRGISMAQAKKTADKVEVATSAGIIKAYADTTAELPGIFVMLQPAGSSDEIDVTSIVCYEEDLSEDHERPVDVAIRTYGDPYNEDITSKVILKREDVMEACMIPVTWDDLCQLAEGTGCKDPQLKAKDAARYAVAELSKELWGYDPEEAEIPEEEIEDICLRHKISFNIAGHILSYRQWILNIRILKPAGCQMSATTISDMARNTLYPTL